MGRPCFRLVGCACVRRTDAVTVKCDDFKTVPDVGHCAGPAVCDQCAIRVAAGFLCFAVPDSASHQHHRYGERNRSLCAPAGHLFGAMAMAVEVEQLHIDLQRNWHCGDIWRHHLRRRLLDFHSLRPADDGAVPLYRLSVCLLYGAGQDRHSARVVDAGHAAVLDLVSPARLCLERHPG